mmetsp:Transcript_13216/g.30080  ORF Transcript_13216/g.30080 Transcript_13216/m.30080 type:complete len:255 (+) Transcript_13216:48-812(+)
MTGFPHGPVVHRQSLVDAGAPSPEDLPLPRWANQLSCVTEIDAETGSTVPRLVLHTLAREGILQQVPRDSSGLLTSVGTILHKRGRCSPCAFWISGRVCLHGVACMFCHSHHELDATERLRPSKQMRVRMQRWMLLKAAEANEPEAVMSPDDNEDLTYLFGTTYKGLKEALTESMCHPHATFSRSAGHASLNDVNIPPKTSALGEFENMLHHHQQQHQQHQRSQPQLVARACLLGRWGPGIMNAGFEKELCHSL